MAAPSDDDDGDEFLFSFFLFEGGAFLPSFHWILGSFLDLRGFAGGRGRQGG